jgi:copper chaperone CopZ
MRTMLMLMMIAALPMVACDGATTTDVQPTAVAEATTLHFLVVGMTCEGCEQAITATLLQQPSVIEAGADHQAGTAWAKVRAGAPSPTSLAATISELGYEAQASTAER